MNTGHKGNTVNKHLPNMHFVISVFKTPFIMTTLHYATTSRPVKITFFFLYFNIVKYTLA